MHIYHTQILIGSHILPYWETHRWDKNVWIVLWRAASASHNAQHCPEQFQLTWILLVLVVGVHKIYCSNIECPIIREVYRSPESRRIGDSDSYKMNGDSDSQSWVCLNPLGLFEGKEALGIHQSVPNTFWVTSPNRQFLWFRLGVSLVLVCAKYFLSD